MRPALEVLAMSGASVVSDGTGETPASSTFEPDAVIECRPSCSGGAGAVLRDGEVVATSRDQATLGRVLLSELHLAVAANARHGLFVHAAAVAWRCVGIVMPARSMAGKSTLVRALVAAGADCYSDEYAVLDATGAPAPVPQAHLDPEHTGNRRHRLGGRRDRRGRACGYRTGPGPPRRVNLVQARERVVAHDLGGRCVRAGPRREHGGGTTGPRDHAPGGHRRRRIRTDRERCTPRRRHRRSPHPRYGRQDRGWSARPQQVNFRDNSSATAKKGLPEIPPVPAKCNRTFRVVAGTGPVPVARSQSEGGPPEGGEGAVPTTTGDPIRVLLPS